MTQPLNVLHHPRRARLAFALLTMAATSSLHAATYVWNNTTSTWENSGAFDVNGVVVTNSPTATDIASFDPTIANPLGVIFNPTINAATDVAAALNLDNNYLGGTYTFSGTGTLTLGTGGITTRGFGTQTFNGPALAGTTTTALSFNVGTDSGLTLSGATVATTTGALNLNGGTMTLDNSASTTAHLVGATPVSLVGGTLSVLGNAAGTSYSLGAASFNAGFNTVSVTPTSGAAVSINFANGTAGSGTSLRTQTYMTEQFVATSGTLGSSGGPKITVTGNPYVDAGGLLGNSATATSQTVGFATVKDAGGTTFATYVAPTSTGGGIMAAAPTRTATDATTLQASTATDFTQFNAPASQVTATAAVSPTALRITPAGAGGSLALGTNNLAANALMLDGANDYTISGTGNLGATGTRYIYVNNATTTLNTSIVIANGTNPTAIAGPGFVVLNGTASQNTLTPNLSGGVPSSANRVNLLGGVLRGNNTEIGFTSAGAGLLSLRGGVLEITGGSNGTGTNADFTRLLANSTSTTSATGSTIVASGTVNWADNTTTDQGSGGFSAYGSAASVNILSTSATSAALVWNTNGFVTDGYALRFGSTQSNAILTFQNSIGLDAGTTGLPYTAREINVTAGTGGDSTVLSGVISGSASSDLLKTGTGTLNLTAANTYAGRTLVEQGTLLASGTGTTGALNATAGVIIKNTGTLQMGATNQFNTTTPAPVTLNGATGTGNAATFSVNGFSQGSTTANGVGALTLAATSANNVIDFNSKNGVVTFASLALNGSTLTINNYLSNSGTSGGPDELIFSGDETANLSSINFTGYGASTEAALGGGFYEVYPGVTAVPEPTTLLGGIFLIGAAGWTQRRRLRRVVA